MNSVPAYRARRNAARSMEVLAYTQDDWELTDVDVVDGPGASTLTNPEAPTIERDAELARRLIALDSSFFEDHGRELSRESRAGLECFMQYSEYRIPLLGADERGTIVATWESGQECVSVRFLDRYYVDYAVTFETLQGLKRKWGRSNLAAVHGECPNLRRLANSD